jgi:molybdopterin-guanine dinucleotide biosynthesis protein A
MNASASQEALGAVLAGGWGHRLGGAKPTVELAGRPLIAYPLGALAAAGLEAIVVAKRASVLPASLGAEIVAEAGEPTHLPPPEIVTEPDRPTHPLAGIVAALRHADRPLVVLGCDFPFVPPALLRALADAAEPLVVPAPGGEPQPLVARWSPDLLPRLDAALAREEPLRRTVAGLAPRLLDDAELARFGEPERIFFNVNSDADRRAAERAISSSGWGSGPRSRPPSSPPASPCPRRSCRGSSP